MGKKSKRREGREIIRQERPLLKPCLTSSILEQKNSASLPPAKPGWTTYQEALHALNDLGWKDAAFVPQYSSERLCATLSTMLASKCICVQDKTHAISNGPNASHQEYAMTVCDLEEASKVMTDTIYIVVRTTTNTPAFLGGCFYTFLADMKNNVETATAYTKKLQTPAIIAFFRGVDISLPTEVAQGGPQLAANILTGMILDDEQKFACKLCDRSFLYKHSEFEFELKAFLACGCCDSPFHAVCTLKYFSTGATQCPVCSQDLPEDWRTCFKTLQKNDPDKLARQIEKFTMS